MPKNHTIRGKVYCELSKNINHLQPQKHEYSQIGMWEYIIILFMGLILSLSIIIVRVRVLVLVLTLTGYNFVCKPAAAPSPSPVQTAAA